MSDFFLFVDAARYPNGDDVMHCGYYALNPNGKASMRYATFSAMRDLPAITTPTKYVVPAGSGKIAVCRPSSFSSPSGTWSETGGVLTVKSGSVLHKFAADPDTPRLYRSANNPAKGSFFKAFGWRTPTLAKPQPLDYEDFYGSYGVPGEWWGTTAAGGWVSQGAGFNPHYFTPKGNAWGYAYDPGDATGLDVYAYVLLNWLPAGWPWQPKSNLVFWNGGAHDYVTDHLAGDDYGHTIIGLACWDAETERVECVLRAECSFEFDGRALAGVGYALPPQLEAA